MYVSINLADKSKRHKCGHVRTQTRWPWRHTHAECKMMQLWMSEHLVCWLEHRRSCDGRLHIQSIPGVWHLHTQPAKQEKSYGEVLLDLRQVHQCQETLFFFLRGWFKYPLQWAAGFSWDCAKNFNEFNWRRLVVFIYSIQQHARLLVFKDNLKVAKDVFLKLLLVPLVSTIIGLSACNELTILIIWLIMDLGHQRVL